MCSLQCLFYRQVAILFHSSHPPTPNSFEVDVFLKLTDIFWNLVGTAPPLSPFIGSMESLPPTFPLSKMKLCACFTWVYIKTCDNTSWLKKLFVWSLVAIKGSMDMEAGVSTAVPSCVLTSDQSVSQFLPTHTADGFVSF